jgi:hypothetical protein
MLMISMVYGFGNARANPGRTRLARLVRKLLEAERLAALLRGLLLRHRLGGGFGLGR